MLLLQAQQVARHFGADILFENVNLDIKDNSKIALVGRNGAGKSTLIKMLIGESLPDEGKIVTKRDLTIGYLAQHTGLESTKNVLDEMLSVFEPLQKMEAKIHQLEEKIASPSIPHESKEYQQLLNQYDQLQHDFQENNGYGYENEVKAVLHGFQFFEEDYGKMVSDLSGGQKTRLALAKLLLEKRDLLILDEPTNHLDIETLTWLENYIQGYTGALLIVSHDRYFLDKVVNEVYELSHQHSSHYVGNYSHYIEEKASRLRTQWKEYEKQQVKIQKLEDFVNKNLVRASTTKRAQSKRKQLEKMDRLERPEGEEKGPHFKFHASKESGNVVLKVTDAAIGYDSKVISNPITFELRKHHVMAVVGPNGIGKSTLLKSILGNIPFIHGSATFGTNVQTGYYDQEQQNLHDKKTVLNEIWDDHPNMLEKDVRSLLGSFLFVGDDVKKVVHNLSGGEKARLTLTKLALQEDNFLMLDEPTNHLDIDSKEVLESALIDFEGTILFVSHDRYFINQVADTVLEITPEGSNLYLGNYDYYLEKKAELEAIEAAKEAEQSQDDQQVSKTSQKQLDYKKSKELQKQQRKLQRLVDDAESEMERLEELKTNIEQEMTLPDNFNDPQKMDELHTKLSKATNDLNEAESKWTELSLELEGLQ
ncbi:ABC-F family ATP-binding cassette domain-containing protein [Ligilactobacillus salivarius]|uniref:ABC-F family ATP-binding cassette domain-containing protein n=1 Tax=Ligilactobacillus salivarius TaxID=1624 RepID=UPI0025A423EA|nr:ABC-F family ATP-binding cassette domain-containing protein [Ligilactobacillus salivarius]MDM8204859.1 ABC-F family ATP-binding cassette domain-containing protein [Ligilactobacillus salivarius]